MASLDAHLNVQLLRLPGGAKLAAMQGRLASFAEQGIQGMGNLLVSAVLARNLGPDGFAVIGLMLGIHFFVLGIHRSAIVLPFILDASRTDQNHAEIENAWWWFNLVSLGVLVLCMVVCALILTLVGRVWPDYAWFGHATWLAVAVSPALLFLEFGRRMLYQRNLPVTAVVVSSVYFLVNLGMAYGVSRATGSFVLSAFSWVVAGAAAGAIAVLAARPDRAAFRAGYEKFLAHKHFVIWQTFNNIPFACYNHSAVLLVGLFGGPLSTAAFVATRALTNPASSMVTAIDALDKPRAARGLAQNGLEGLRKSVNQTRRTLLILCGGYLGALAIFAAPVLHFAFGPAYDNHVHEIRVLAMAFFLMCMNQPSETFLIVLRASKLMLLARCMTCGVMLLSLYLAQPYGLLGICIAFTVTQASNLFGLRLAEYFAQKGVRRLAGA